MEDKLLEEQQAYDVDQIQVLEGLEDVRKRPSMYIGSTGEKGLHHLVWEITDNSIDEALAGYCDEINITIESDNSITVQDNGRGIPTNVHEDSGRPAVELILTVLHAGGKFGGGGYKVSGGLHGVGASVVNALSTHLKVYVHRNGEIFYLEFRQGEPVEEIKIIGKTEKTGTIINFKPDPEIFTESTDFDYDILKNRLRELAFLNKKLTITLKDNRVEKEKE